MLRWRRFNAIPTIYSYFLPVGLPQPGRPVPSAPGVFQPAGSCASPLPMIDQAALRKRIRRLEELSLGLARDEWHFEKASVPLMADERDKYREGLRQAIGGVETARLLTGEVVRSTRPTFGL